jgi:hypothetical protein
MIKYMKRITTPNKRRELPMLAPAFAVLPDDEPPSAKAEIVDKLVNAETAAIDEAVLMNDLIVIKKYLQI